MPAHLGFGRQRVPLKASEEDLSVAKAPRNLSNHLPARGLSGASYGTF